MATFDSKRFVDQLIAGNGRIDPEEAPDNPWAVKIVEYTNMAGRQAWGVVFANEAPETWGRYEVETEYVGAPRVIWERPQETR